MMSVRLPLPTFLFATHFVGFERGNELSDAIRDGKATVVEHLGRITGYATDIGFSPMRLRKQTMT